MANTDETEIKRFEANTEKSIQPVNNMKAAVFNMGINSIQENMPQFVESFKELKLLQIERQAQLEHFAIQQQNSITKFKELSNKVNQRMESQLDSIKEIINKLLSLSPQTEMDFHSQELMLRALQDMQKMYLSELDSLINI